MCGLAALTLVFALEIITFWLKSTKEEMRQARRVRQLRAREGITDIEPPSTSTLTSPVINGGGFGPTGARCYGIGYTTGAASYLHEMRDLLWQGCKRILMYWVCGDFCVLMRAQQRHGHVRMRADASRHVVLGFVPCKAL